jgi:hypothetical protein
MDHPNIQTDTSSIPVPGSVRREAQEQPKVKVLATVMVDKWDSQEAFDAGLPPSGQEAQVREFELTQEQADELSRQMQQ